MENKSNKKITLDTEPTQSTLFLRTPIDEVVSIAGTVFGVFNGGLSL